MIKFLDTNGKKSGNMGEASRFSFYRSKYKETSREVGANTTNDEEFAITLKAVYTSINSRLDDSKPSSLNIKLRFPDTDKTNQREVAECYILEFKIKNHPSNLSHIMTTIRGILLQNYFLL